LLLKIKGFRGYSLQNLRNQLGWKNARNYYIAVPGVQKQELLNDEEQEDDHWPPRVLEVLQYLPQAHGPQGNEVREALSRQPLAFS
jgi:hypothetical protein